MLHGHLWVDVGVCTYYYDVTGVRKLSIEGRIIMTYSPYIYEQSLVTRKLIRTLESIITTGS